MALNKDEHYEEKWVGRKLLYRLHPAFDWREMPYDELCNKICDLENELKRVRAKTSEREQANENIPLVSGSAFIAKADRENILVLVDDKYKVFNKLREIGKTWKSITIEQIDKVV